MKNTVGKFTVGLGIIAILLVVIRFLKLFP